jgi:hypothetical protein
MRSSNLFGAALFAALTSLHTPDAQAVTPYVGGAAGLSTARNFDADIFNADLSFDSSRTDEDKENLGYRVVGGLSFSRWFALEAAYVDLGKSTFSTQSNGPPCCISAEYQPGPVSGGIAVNGIEFGIAGRWPLPDDSVMGLRAGMLKWTLDSEVRDSNGPKDIPKEQDTDPFLGLDVFVPIFPQLDLLINWTLYHISTSEVNRFRSMNKYDVDLLEIGLVYRFEKG